MATPGLELCSFSRQELSGDNEAQQRYSTTSSKHNPRLLIVEVGQEWWDWVASLFLVVFISFVCSCCFFCCCRKPTVRWAGAHQACDNSLVGCGLFIKRSEPGLTRPRGAPRTRPLGRLDRCGWSGRQGHPGEPRNSTRWSGVGCVCVCVWGGGGGGEGKSAYL